MALIYFADDDLDARALVKGCLSLDGHRTVCFASGEELIGEFLRNPCDLVILDVMMPKADGFEVLGKIRSISSIPIIMLTAKTGENDCYSGFAHGADDYIGKPFRPVLLRGKVHALLSRAALAPGKQLKKTSLEDLVCGNLCSSKGDASFSVGERSLLLTPVERKYLYFMMQRYNNPVAREEALEEVWGLGDAVKSRVVDETNRRVRVKLSKLGASVVLESIWGFGYILKDEVSS